VFMEIGMTIDNKIEDIKGWNRKRSWYKFYTCIYLLKRKKSSDFKAMLELFYEIGYLYRWQYEKLKKHRTTINGLKGTDTPA